MAQRYKRIVVPFARWRFARLQTCIATWKTPLDSGGKTVMRDVENAATLGPPRRCLESTFAMWMT